MARPKRRPGPSRKPGATRSAGAPLAPKVPVTFHRAPWERIYAAGFGVAFSVLVVLNIVGGPGLLRTGALVPLVLVCACDLVCWRLFRLEVTAAERGLLVRNYLRTYRLDWDEVAAFRIETPPTRLEGPSLHVIRNAGKPIRLDASVHLLSQVRQVDARAGALATRRDQLDAWVR